jgi:tetratricopeptide (TPR) repeat protein
VANYRLGAIYYGRMEYERAASYLEKVINLYPFDYDGLVLYAWTNLKMKKLREAKLLFRKALLARPGDTSATEGLRLLE